MKTLLPLLAAIVLLTWSPAASASDPSGLLFAVVIVVIGIPYVLGSMAWMISGCSKRKYASRAYAMKHVVIASTFLALGMFAFLAGMVDDGGFLMPETLISAGVLVALPAIVALVPWLLHLWQREHAP